MNIFLTLRILGALLIFLAGALLLPIPFSLFYGDGATAAFLFSAGISLLAGAALFSRFPSQKELSVREGFAIVTFGWTFFALFGALPFVLSGAIPSYVDAFSRQ
jgi:trk system potassium uptake protein TrkH